MNECVKNSFPQKLCGGEAIPNFGWIEKEGRGEATLLYNKQKKAPMLPGLFLMAALTSRRSSVAPGLAFAGRQAGRQAGLGLTMRRSHWPEFSGLRSPLLNIYLPFIGLSSRTVLIIECGHLINAESASDTTEKSKPDFTPRVCPATQPSGEPLKVLFSVAFVLACWLCIPLFVPVVCL